MRSRGGTFNGLTITNNGANTLNIPNGATMTFPGSSDTVATLGATQTLTSKTLTAPVMTAPSISGGGSWSGSPTITNPTLTNSAGGGIHLPSTPSSGADSLVQQSGGGVYYPDTSSSTTSYTVAISNYAGNVAGSWFFFTPTNTNTGAATLQVNSLTAAPITKLWDQALVASDLVAGVTYLLLFNGSNFAVMSPGQKLRVPASRTSLYDITDPTKVVTFTASQITTGNTRQASWPDASGTVLLSNLNVVTFSSTPTIGTAHGSVQFLTIPSGTASVSATMASGAFLGQMITLYLLNSSSVLTFTYPSGTRNGFAVTNTGSYVQDFFWNGTNWIGKAQAYFP